jgi:hypothetical protein
LLKALAPDGRFVALYTSDRMHLPHFESKYLISRLRADPSRGVGIVRLGSSAHNEYEVKLQNRASPPVGHRDGYSEAVSTRKK